jgi:hypothetical protein
MEVRRMVELTAEEAAELELAELLDMLCRGLRQNVKGDAPTAWRPEEAHVRCP